MFHVKQEARVNLEVWRVGPDIVVAESAADAKAVVGDHHGCQDDDEIERPVCLQHRS